MDADDTYLKPLIEGSKQFIIPVFQRDYSWSEEQCEQLWKDIVRIGDEQKKRVHFIGSVVYINAESNSPAFNRWLVIDGQQRLTTLTLILIALRDYWEENRNKGDSKADQIEHEFLINQYGTEDKRQKLRLRKTDDDTLSWLLQRQHQRTDRNKPANISQRLIDNYEDFKSRINESNSVIVENGLNKLVFVLVTLVRGEDDPQMIFESLNSTGLDLTPGDLVRNFVLMREEEKHQTELYNRYWNPIENSFGKSYREHFDKFLNAYLVIKTKQNKTIKSDEVYPQFKNYFLDVLEEKSIEEELCEMGRHGSFYAKYVLGNEEINDLAKSFARLRIQVDIAVPIVLKLYSLFDETKIALNEFVEAIDLLESYVFRRSICAMQTRSLGNIMATLSNKIAPENPLESLKVALKLRPENQKFPSNEEFKHALMNSDIYHLRPNCNVLLTRLENHNSKEVIPTGSYTIEHIMPQNLRSEWKEMLGESWQEIQTNWLHRLGNLTLTGYNSDYSDRPFNEKKSIPGGFDESPLRLNKYMRETNYWTDKEMESRALSLTEMSIAEWPNLKVSREAVNKAQLEEIKKKNSRYSIETIEVRGMVKDLFTKSRQELLNIDKLVEVFHKKSVTYRRHYDFVVEVIPRARHLTLLLNIEFDELTISSDKLINTNTYRFVTGATESGGVLIDVRNEDDLELAIEVVKQII